MTYCIKPAGPRDIKAFEQALQSLNYRYKSRALGLWQGEEIRTSDQSLYEDVEHILNPETLKAIRKSELPTTVGHRLFHNLLEHYLQSRLFPYENELFTWTKGASAHVNGEKIYFKDILSWCQKQSDLESRRTIEKETTALCKFLKPFALAFWEYLIELINEEFEYSSYLAYCADKKHLHYDAYVPLLEELMGDTEAVYFGAMESWARESLGVSLSQLNRFDAIYLLGLGEYDLLFPNRIPLTDCLTFFEHWGIDVGKIPGLRLHMDRSFKKTSQAMSFALRIPQEVHVVMNPQGGWIDLETLFHELGHGLSHTFTSQDLSPVEREFFTSNTLSETYAFLLQNICLSPQFLERQLGLSDEAIDTISAKKTLRDLSVFKRYVGKFLAEYEMFGKNDVESGNAYARLLKKHTGFSYQPETQLFDLGPEFYALDYVISWIAEATMESRLLEACGEDWMFKRETGRILKDWWRDGNRYELDEFFAVKGIGPIDVAHIRDRWSKKISES